NSPSAEEDLISRNRRKIACMVILALPDECRRLWRMVFIGKKTYGEVAESLKVAEGTIKRKMWQCRQEAQKKLESLEKS
ncbi:MAG: hypothetical protein ABIJ61_00505, partial [bacterium]